MAALHSCVLLMTLVAVALSLDLASAKRGCSSFGHSCFGGHGKRSDEDFPAPDYQQESEPEHTMERLPEGRPGDLVPLLRQWLQLQSYRRLAEGNPN